MTAPRNVSLRARLAAPCLAGLLAGVHAKGALARVAVSEPCSAEKSIAEAIVQLVEQ